MTHSPDTGGDLSEATAEPGFLTVAPLLPAVDKIHRQLKQPRGLEAAGGVVSQDWTRSTPAFGALRRWWSQCSLGAGQERFSEGGVCRVGGKQTSREERPWLQIREQGRCWQSQGYSRGSVGQRAGGLADCKRL